MMIYISGKMTGIKDYNYPEFNRVAKDLRSFKYDVFNPAEIKLDTKNMSKNEIYEAYMTICLTALDKCHKIFLLRGWEHSPGAKRELKKALELGLEIELQL